MDLTTATPVEIDTLLAPIWEREENAKSRIVNYKRRETEIFATIEKIKKGEKVLRVTTAMDGIELMEDLARIGRFIVAEGNKLAAAEAEAAPYEAEYTRRGGWNRVFLATSINGHAHNGSECSTCHNGQYRTAFSWLIQYSGQDEDEIVADAGWRACTTCYPTAPVGNSDALPTKMFTPDEEEAARAREAREAERARKAQAASDKSIFTPEGGTLYETKDNSSYSAIKNIRTAEIAATDALYELVREQQHSVDPEYAWLYESGRDNTDKNQMVLTRHAWCLIRSIAHKKGQTFEETFQVHEKKAQAKIRKADREWAKDPRNPNRTK
jgi:hypothetical protein